MPVYVGGSKIGNVYLGSTAVQRVMLGSTLVWPELSEQTFEMTTAGIINDRFVIPWWAETVDIVVLGAGGGGGAPSGFFNGGGGGEGKWASQRLLKAQFPADRTLTYTVGRGGLGQQFNATIGAANDGDSSTVTWTGGSLSGAGGKCNVGFQKTHNGYSPGNHVFQGKTYVAGTALTGGALNNPPPGNPPGVGGNGAAGVLNTGPGSDGARGQIWFRVLPP